MACILVIDDEAPVRTLFRRILEKEQYEVLEASDGQAGMRLLRENPVDLVITDIFMPEKDGIEVLLELRKASPKLKVIVVSGGGKRVKLDMTQAARIFGAFRILRKPLEPQEVLDAVKEALAG